MAEEAIGELRSTDPSGALLRREIPFYVHALSAATGRSAAWHGCRETKRAIVCTRNMRSLLLRGCPLMTANAWSLETTYVVPFGAVKVHLSVGRLNLFLGVTRAAKLGRIPGVATCTHMSSHWCCSNTRTGCSAAGRVGLATGAFVGVARLDVA
jgi:hypothetical protein